MLIEIILAAAAVSLISLIGVFFFGTSGYLTGTHRFILPVAVGVFLGVVFFELIPETLEASMEWGPIAIVAGFFGFYLLSYFLETFHHHHFDKEDTCSKNGAQKLLIGDAIHNFADGVVIASAFMIDPTIGVLATAGIAFHEIPQEIAEFGVLMQSGYTKREAIRYNFISALSVILGAVVTYFFADSFSDYLFILTGVAAGNLLYIATADLIPELRHTHNDHFFKTFGMTIASLAAIAVLIHISHGPAHDEEVLHDEDQELHEQI